MPATATLQKPLDGYYVWETGDIVLRAYLDLDLGDPQGGWHTTRFRVDCGSDMTTVPAAWAKGLGLPLGRGPVQFTQRTADGRHHAVTVRSGLLMVRVTGLDPTVYYFPCYFIGDPDTAAPPAAAGIVPRNLLGLTGVVDKIRLTLDGTPALGAAYGHLVVEKK